MPELKVLSLGAGVQSSTIFMMSCLGELDRLDAAVFADTGWEPRAVYKWLAWLKDQGKRYGIPVFTVKHGDIKSDALISQVRGLKVNGVRWASMPFFVLGRDDGKRGMIRRQCTYEYKIRPLEKEFRRIAGYKKYARIPIGGIEVWKGISVDESRRATISRVRWISFYYPLIEKGIDRAACLKWFSDRGFPEPPRSACIGCPYHSNKEWLRLRDDHPEEWRDAVEFDRGIRKIGGMRGDCFLHAARVPLDEVKLDKCTRQLSLFSDECAGVCGV